MYIRRIQIDDFRGLKNIDIGLGKYTTAISGHNATGKSTILALLGHCAELRVHKPIIKSQYRCEWDEIINASREHDPKSPNIGSISFIELGDDDVETPVETFSYRTTWQKYRDAERFRLLPARVVDGHQSSKKVTWPTLYLGLSRLYPIGESNQISIEKKDLSLWGDELKNAYNQILHLKKDEILGFGSISISETSRKTAIGIVTERYDTVCNSAGQDNLGQIILAILSFQQLKEAMGTAWAGGLLLIDELDATLHPASLVKLYDYITMQARTIGIQVVFTTHSLYLIEQINKKTEYNSPAVFNGHELVYLTSDNGPVCQIPSPSFENIYYDLTVTMRTIDTWRPIIVYAEDDEARWFLGKLIPEHINRVKCPSIKMGCSNLLQLLRHDYEHFKTHIFLLDGDAKRHEEDTLKIDLGRDEIPNLVRLPGDVSPEKLLFDYYLALEGKDHALLSDPSLRNDGISIRNVREALKEVDSQEIGAEKAREIYKRQFKRCAALMEKLYPYWAEDNAKTVGLFTRDFRSAFNQAAKYAGVRAIK